MDEPPNKKFIIGVAIAVIGLIIMITGSTAPPPNGWVRYAIIGGIILLVGAGFALSSGIEL